MGAVVAVESPPASATVGDTASGAGEPVLEASLGVPLGDALLVPIVARTSIGWPHLRQVIRRVFPATLSSGTWYLAWHLSQLNFIRQSELRNGDDGFGRFWREDYDGFMGVGESDPAQPTHFVVCLVLLALELCGR